MATSLLKVIPLGLAMVAVYLVWTAATDVGGGRIICEAPVVVEVLNGCGISGIADDVAGFLSDKDFDVMFVGNAGDFGYRETVVVDRSGDRSKALEVARVLGRKPVVYQVNSSSFVDVTVIVGTDLPRGIPPAETAR